MNRRRPFVKWLLNINNAYTFFIASWHMGLMISVVLFWYPGWNGLTINTTQNSFNIPAQIATKLFVKLVPLAITTSFIMILSEWKTPLRWPAIFALTGLTGASITAKYFLFPINDIIYAGVKDQAELTRLLLKWMSLNNWRVFFSCLTWLSMIIFYSMKTERQTK